MAQSLDDRPVGIFLGYTFADTFDPNAIENFVYSGTTLVPSVTYGRLHNEGLDFGVYVRQNRWLRWRADVSAGGAFLGPGDDFELGGPEFTVRAGPAVFFAHALFGRGSVGGGLFGESRSGFAMAFGGGVDLRITSWFALRLIDADYLPSHLTGPAYFPLTLSSPAPQVTTWENNSRVTLGIVFKAGKKI